MSTKVEKILHDGLFDYFSTMESLDKEKFLQLIKEADSLINEADSLINKQWLASDLYHNTVAILNEALKIDPSNIDALTKKAQVLVRCCEYDEALEISNRVLSTDFNNIGVLNSKADCLLYNGSIQEALGIIDKILEIDRKNSYARINKSRAFIRLGKMKEALNIIDEGLEIEPTHVSLLWQKDHILSEQKKYAELYAELHNNRELLLERIKNYPNGEWLRYASDELKNDKKFILSIVGQPSMVAMGDYLKYASDELKDDITVVLSAVTASSYSFSSALRYASQRLRDNREVVLAAVKNDGSMIRYASMRLQNNREVVLNAVKSLSGWWALKYFGLFFRDDIEVVRAAINQDGKALQYASPRLRRNREIVLAAVKQNGNAILYASPSFYDDKEIVLAALNSPGPYEDHAGHYMCSGGQCVYEEIRGCISRRLREDPDVDNTFTNYGNLVSNLFHWKELRDEKERAEERWQEKYGHAYKERLERWQYDVVQWGEVFKKDQYNTYKVWRTELERMPRYESWRQDVFAKRGRMCEICGDTKNLEIHHRKTLYLIWKQEGLNNIYQAFECDRLWDIENGSVLCHECHSQMESSKKHSVLLS